MTIDVEPIEREPSDFERTFMEILGYKEIYYFIQGDKQYSVHWTKETIGEFLPRWFVSEFIENYLFNYSSLFAHCMQSWENQVHPFWTTAQVQERYGKFYKTGKEVPSPFGEPYVKGSARHWVKYTYEQFTKPLQFVVVKLK